MKPLFRIVILMFALGSGARAQDSVALSSGSANLAVRTNVPGARVFLDDSLVGRSPITEILVPPGRHIVRCEHPDTTRWPRIVVFDTLNIAAFSSVERVIEFPTYYFVHSDPDGASVIAEDTLLGTTPLYLASSLGGKVVTFSRPGYEDATVVAPPGGGSVYGRLSRVDGFTGSGSPLMLPNEHSKDLVPIIVASGATIMAGSVAAYFKVRADRSYDEYLLTGSPGARARMDAFDTYASIALVTSQLSLFALSYLLLSQ